MIARIDGTENEIEGIEIQAFPTIFLFKKGKNKKRIEYHGKNTLEGIKEFLEDQLDQDWLDDVADELEKEEMDQILAEHEDL